MDGVVVTGLINRVLRRQKNAVKFLRLGFVLVLVAFIFWKVNFQLLVSHMSWSLGKALLCLQPLVLVGLTLHALRIALLANLPLNSIRITLASLVLSQGMNFVIPARLSELLKVTYLSAHAKVPVSQGLAVIMLERAVDLLIFGLIAILSVVLFATGRAGWSAALISVVGVAVILLSPWIMRCAARFIDGEEDGRVKTFIRNLADSLIRGIRNPKFLIATILGMLTWAASVSNAVIFLFLAVPDIFSLQTSLAFFVATTIGGALPALPGGFGIYEAAAVFVLKPLGLSFEEALIIGLTFHVAHYIIPCLGAALIMGIERSGVSQLIKQLRG